MALSLSSGGRRLVAVGDNRLENQHRHCPLAPDPRNGRIFLSGGYNVAPHAPSKRKATVSSPRPHSSSNPKSSAPPSTHPFSTTTISTRARRWPVACLDLDGKPVWASDPSQQFGLGSFLLAGGLIFAMNDSGLLRLIQATPTNTPCWPRPRSSKAANPGAGWRWRATG